MKKGISLIVLVITIIVMIIIAGAIIISLSQTNVIDQATTATEKSNDAEARALVAMVYASNINKATDGWDRALDSDVADAINTQLSTQFPGSTYAVTVTNGNVTCNW